VLISSAGSPGRSQRAVEAGFDAILTKPLRHRGLIDALKRLCSSVPASDPRDHSVLPGHETAGQEEAAGYRVLLADDNQINHGVAVALLRKAGLVVDGVDSGEAALNAFFPGL
jgi:CheY-like chemotaxis protein